MMMRLRRPARWAGVVFAFGLASCATHHHHAPITAEAPGGLYATAVFAKDGTLWRVSPTKERVYVDWSKDKGVTYSAPVAVNAQPQRVRATSEDRPDIGVDGQGRVYVLYAMDSAQPWSTQYAVSNDGGRHFSSPVPLSDYASRVRNHQGKLLVGEQGAYAFWHDERESQDRSAGNALFFARLDQSAANRKVIDNTCECCRLATDFAADGKPVLLARMVYPGQVRDHALLVEQSPERGWQHVRVTQDDWKTNTCPHHGPALAVAADGAYHLAWLASTSGERKGLYYAKYRQGRLDDSVPIGQANKGASDPAIATLGNRVALAWLEYDGRTHEVWVQQSEDGGGRWQPAQILAQTTAAADAPQLIEDGSAIFLSWSNAEKGHELYRLP